MGELYGLFYSSIKLLQKEKKETSWIPAFRKGWYGAGNTHFGWTYQMTENKTYHIDYLI